MEHTGAEPDLAVRRADAADAAPLAELYLRARRAAVPSVPPLVHTDEDVRRWIKDVVVPQRETWVAEHNGEVVALLVLDGDDVDQLYVSPDRTGRGIGSALVRFAQHRRPNGLSLWTFQSNHGARRFYERHGFVAAEYTDGHGNEEQAPDMRYVWAGDDWRPSPNNERPGVDMSLQLRPLATLTISIGQHTRLDGVPAHARLIGEATACELVGDRVRASQAGTSSDWLTLHEDGSVSVDARLLLATSGGGHLTITYRGRAAALPATGAPVYITPTFETDDPDLAWLNHVQAVGKGLRDGQVLVYELYELV